MSEDWVKVGTEMVVVDRMLTGGYGAIRKIAKVHKNGNFTLEGSPQQYRPSSIMTGNSTGGIWSMTTVKVVTDDMRAKITEGYRYGEAYRKVYNALDKHLRLMHTYNREQLERLDKALQEIEP